MTSCAVFAAVQHLILTPAAHRGLQVVSDAQPKTERGASPGARRGKGRKGRRAAQSRGRCSPSGGTPVSVVSCTVRGGHARPCRGMRDVLTESSSVSAAFQSRQRRSRAFRGCPVAESAKAAPSLCRRTGPRLLSRLQTQQQRGMSPCRSTGGESQQSTSSTAGWRRQSATAPSAAAAAAAAAAAPLSPSGPSPRGLLSRSIPMAPPASRTQIPPFAASADPLAPPSRRHRGRRRVPLGDGSLQDGGADPCDQACGPGLPIAASPRLKANPGRRVCLLSLLYSLLLRRPQPQGEPRHLHQGPSSACSAPSSRTRAST